MHNDVVQEGGYEYIESKGGDVDVLLLHGLFGSLSNFEHLLNEFGNKYNFIVPLLPILTAPKEEVGLDGLLGFINGFVEYKGFDKLHVLGNSLGGHLAQLFAIDNPEKVSSLILTGSSGLFENPMGSSWPRRESYDYVREKVESTFYDPKMAQKEMVDEVFKIVNDRSKVIRIVITAKSAIRHNLADKLGSIKVPTLLVWGKQDEITPPFVAEKFEELLPNATLVFLDKCGHAAMMEQPKAFNEAFASFIEQF
jgi:pimeloyl-ACP methyl ester carboxylesterase